MSFFLLFLSFLKNIRNESSAVCVLLSDDDATCAIFYSSFMQAVAGSGLTSFSRIVE